MEEKMKQEWKKMSRLTVAAWSLVGVGLVGLIAGFAIPTGPSSVLTNLNEGEVLGFGFFLVLWIIGMVFLGMVEYLKKVNDLVTYREILAFSKGEQPDRVSNTFARRHPLARSILMFSVSAFAGAIIGIVIFHLLQSAAAFFKLRHKQATFEPEIAFFGGFFKLRHFSWRWVTRCHVSR